MHCDVRKDLEPLCEAVHAVRQNKVPELSGFLGSVHSSAAWRATAAASNTSSYASAIERHTTVLYTKGVTGYQCQGYTRVLQRAQGVVQKWNADILQRRLCRSSVACGEGVHRGGRCHDQPRK